ncbi:hypothetical protein [Pseudomonas fluorescens]|uniref:Uncharacterized protein n=1 Tax=Pseudomonas fluorescens TaxID=294 RepID=A0A5E7VM11_PSEFL|nr:hypothetical protein [Pseudomonas fluorescens]VVQ23759.1 hypothetical protein PS941_05624 [Pseudomonas fluorescens]
MTALLLLYLCTDATRTNCQMLPTQHWQGSNAYDQCMAAIPHLTNALTTQNRQRHQFVCEIPTDTAHPAEHQAQPAFIHQSFRM